MHTLPLSLATTGSLGGGLASDKRGTDTGYALPSVAFLLAGPLCGVDSHINPHMARYVPQHGRLVNIVMFVLLTIRLLPWKWFDVSLFLCGSPDWYDWFAEGHQGTPLHAVSNHRPIVRLQISARIYLQEI